MAKELLKTITILIIRNNQILVTLNDSLPTIIITKITDVKTIKNNVKDKFGKLILIENDDIDIVKYKSTSTGKPEHNTIVIRYNNIYIDDNDTYKWIEFSSIYEKYKSNIDYLKQRGYIDKNIGKYYTVNKYTLKEIDVIENIENFFDTLLKNIVPIDILPNIYLEKIKYEIILNKYINLDGLFHDNIDPYIIKYKKPINAIQYDLNYLIIENSIANYHGDNKELKISRIIITLNKQENITTLNLNNSYVIVFIVKGFNIYYSITSISPLKKNIFLSPKNIKDLFQIPAKIKHNNIILYNFIMTDLCEITNSYKNNDYPLFDIAWSVIKNPLFGVFDNNFTNLTREIKKKISLIQFSTNDNIPFNLYFILNKLSKRIYNTDNKDIQEYIILIDEKKEELNNYYKFVSNVKTNL